MYCQLGQLIFERREYLAGLEGVHKFDFAEQAHVEGKPGLQAIGSALDTYSLDLVFHHGWCDPAASITKLLEVAGRKEAQSLVFGDGTYLGKFVVLELQKTWQHTRPDATLLYAVVRVQLKEFVDLDPVVSYRKRAAAAAPAVKVHSTAHRTTVAKPGVKAKTGTPAYTVLTSMLPGDVPASEIVRR